MTRFSVRYLVNGEWENTALFSDATPLDAICNFCDCLLTAIDDCDCVEAVDMEENIVIYSVEGGYDYEDDVDETGFNPYEGCYDYDC